MTKAPQKLAHEIGETGCYALSIVYLAEDEGGTALDPLAAIQWGLDDGCLALDNGIYVKNAAKFLSLLTNRAWTCEKAGPDHGLGLSYECRPNQREILRFERPVKAGQEPAHFVVGDGFGRVVWDPYGSSQTARTGVLVSKRIFRRIGG